MPISTGYIGLLPGAAARRKTFESGGIAIETFASRDRDPSPAFEQLKN